MCDNQERKSKARQALLVWILFFAATISINLLIPTALGISLNNWSSSTAQTLLLSSIGYAGFFTIVPLLLTKGWNNMKKPSFLIPMAIAAASVVFWNQIHYIAATVIAVYVYLHLKFDLSDWASGQKAGRATQPQSFW